jgi:tRNA-2-methylthio-N6-dimethylallyladenosine synthase
VGFPGESEEDFSSTLSLMCDVGYDQAFTFIYSPREGTPAATMTDQIPRHVAQERFDRLVEVVHASALRASTEYVGTVQEVLVEGASKRDNRMLSGRTPTYRVVHARVPEGHDAHEYEGHRVRVRITEAQTWFLNGTLEGTRTQDTL